MSHNPPFWIRPSKLDSRMPGRDDVSHVEYHRKPTPSEIKRGYGAVHYRIFELSECVHPGTRFLKNWFVADDGLRYYR